MITFDNQLVQENIDLMARSANVIIFHSFESKMVAGQLLNYMSNLMNPDVTLFKDLTGPGFRYFAHNRDEERVHLIEFHHYKRDKLFQLVEPYQSVTINPLENELNYFYTESAKNNKRILATLDENALLFQWGNLKENSIPKLFEDSHMEKSVAYVLEVSLNSDPSEFIEDQFSDAIVMDDNYAKVNILAAKFNRETGSFTLEDTCMSSNLNVIDL